MQFFLHRTRPDVQTPPPVQTWRCVVFFALTGPLLGVAFLLLGQLLSLMAEPPSRSTPMPISLFGFLTSLVIFVFIAGIFVVVFMLPSAFRIGLLPAMFVGWTYATVLRYFRPVGCPSPRQQALLGALCGLPAFFVMQFVPVDRHGPISWLCLVSAVGCAMLIRPRVFQWLSRQAKAPE